MQQLSNDDRFLLDKYLVELAESGEEGEYVLLKTESMGSKSAQLHGLAKSLGLRISVNKDKSSRVSLMGTRHIIFKVKKRGKYNEVSTT